MALHSLVSKMGRKEKLALAVCLVVALAVRLWGIGFGLPHRYHVDEPPSVLAALRMGQGDFQIAYPLLAPSLVEFLYLALFGVLLLWYLVTGQITSLSDFAHQYRVDPTGFYLLARGLSVVASLSTVILLYYLARRRRDHRTALVASLFLSLSFLDVRHAHFAEAYSIMGFFILAATCLALVYVEHGRKRDLALASVLCGVAMGLRYSTLPLVGTLLLGLLLRARTGDHEQPLRVLLVLLASTTALGFVIGDPAIVLNSRHFFKNIAVLSGLAVDQQGLWGFQMTNMPTWQFYATIVEIAFGLPLTLMSLAGIAHALWRHRRQDVLLLSFPIMYGILLLGASAAGSAYARYLIPTLPFLALFAADSTITLVDWLSRRRSPGAATAVLSVLVSVLVAIPFRRVVLLDHLWTQTDTRSLAVDWIEANVPEGARIAMQWHSPPLSTVDDPEPDTSHVYDVVVMDPFSAEETLYQMDYYRQEGFDYVVLSSFIYNLARVDPNENALRRSFYASLDQQAELVAEFQPYTGEVAPPYFFEQMWGPVTNLVEFERPGPTIKIYKLRSATHDTTVGVPMVVSTAYDSAIIPDKTASRRN